MSQMIDSAVLGAWTFFASAHAIDVCGINGLPLTPNSIRILGQFQKLKTLSHKRLSRYLDIQRGKHERVMIVCEHYQEGLQQNKFRYISKNIKNLVNIAFEILDGISYLHSQGITHRCLSPSCVRFDSEGHVKLSNYGLYYMTEVGSTVSFPIGVPKYMAPEVLISGPNECHCPPKCDVWSFGLIILEFVLGIELWSGFSLKSIFRVILSFTNCKNGFDVLNSISESHNVSSEFRVIPSSLLKLLAECLTPKSAVRPEAHELLQHAVFQEHNLGINSTALLSSSLFLSTQLRCKESNELNKSTSLIENHLSQRPLEEVYYLWQLAGGDLEAELRRQELIRAKPPVVTISKIVIGEGEEFGHEKDCAYLLDDSVLTLPLKPLQHRLRDIDPEIYYPLTEYDLNGFSSLRRATLKETAKLPLVIKEKDVEYQLHRIILFRRLLEAYPYKRPQILHEAKTDIPPLYRSRIWTALLEIEGNVHAIYDSIDKETPTPTDRQTLGSTSSIHSILGNSIVKVIPGDQIEVDIPRCHQYDEMLSSPVGHLKFKRILKAWIVSHPEYVYWQGLDSLCAPFLSLNFNDEALAYACLSTFISKYLHNFFLKDNSAVIQEYLAKFSHLIAYHDPDLTNHLDNIGFIPELYAIPWFLTMYTHVFPLHKIFHLWDTLLLGHSSFPLCIGVSILKQLRNNLLSYGFNECILMFSDMPEIDIQRCVQDSIKIFCSTPKSITYRIHENPNPKANIPFIASRLKINIDDVIFDPDLMMTPIPLHELKMETSPRISVEDVLDLLDLIPNLKKIKSQSVKILVIDIRSSEEYCRGSLLKSINIPYDSAFSSDGTLDHPSVNNFKGKIIAVVGSNKDKLASEFASKLVKSGHSYVCTLHGGIEILRKTGFLIAKTE